MRARIKQIENIMINLFFNFSINYRKKYMENLFIFFCFLIFITLM